MILLCGIPSEGPLVMAAQALDALGVPYLFFNQRCFETSDIYFEISRSGVSGWLELGEQGIPLESISSIYTRMMDYRRLPELRGKPETDAGFQHCVRLNDALLRWLDVTPSLVVNRASAMASNSSKPYQAQLISAYGFDIPETLVTNDPESALEFIGRHESVIYKSTSGIRSIVHRFSPEDRERIESVRWCVTQFQEYVEGRDMRVHVVGNDVFATDVESAATDYRYSQRQSGASARLTASTIKDDVAERCIELTRGLGLIFSGIDLRFCNDGRLVCFEVNPCPGYSYFEANSGQSISGALASLLTGSGSSNLANVNAPICTESQTCQICEI